MRDEPRHHMVARACDGGTHWVGCETCRWWYERRLLGPFDYMSRVAVMVHVQGPVLVLGTESVPELAPRVTDVSADPESPEQRLEEV